MIRNNKASIIRYILPLCVMAFWFLNNFTAANADNSYSLKHKLENKHLLVSATKSPMIQNKELTPVSAGVMEDMIMKMLSSQMKFTYEVVPPPDILSPGYLQKNGSWTGTAGQLQRREVDMCATTSASLSSKFDIQDISYPVVFADASILIPFPTEKTIYVDASAFQYKAWIAIGIFSVLMVLAAWIIHRITKSSSDMNCQNSLPFWIFYFLSAWTNTQAATLRNRTTPLRLVCIVAFFGIFIIMNYFTASYTSVLSIPNFKMPISSIEDLANNEDLNPLILKGSSTDEYISTSMNPIMKKVNERLQNPPERRILNAFTVKDISTVVKDNSALIVIKSTAESLIHQSYKINNKCRVTLAEKTFYSRPQVFTYPKNSPIAKSIDYNLLLLQQAGLMQYAEKRSAPPDNRCSLSESKKMAANKTAPLKLKELAGVFIILVLGSVFSFVIFLFECILKKIKTNWFIGFI